MDHPPDPPWWRNAAIYQIYPRSFLDTNGDGIGDLAGVTARLDYVQELGFDAVWLSPFFASPQQDWGYDVSDYYAVAPEYGALRDVEELLAEAHRRGLRVLFDLVLNHTSDQHPWFQESQSSRHNAKRDWYIWRDGRGRRPPNNWKAMPGGSAWHYHEDTEQWYYAGFLPFQPDLNYRNPAVKAAMLDVVRYWLDKGVDGFRLDIFHAIFEDDRLRNNPFSWRYFPSDSEPGFFQQWVYNLHRPETIAFARELRALVDSYSPDRLLLGEVFGDHDTVKRYLGEPPDGLHLIFLWDLLRFQPTARFFRDLLRRTEKLYPTPYVPTYVLGNHDRQRVLSRIGGDLRLMKLLALIQFTARGVPVTYYGEEIGMVEAHLPAKTAKDPLGRRYGWIPQIVLDALGIYVNRDGCRTPMQWNPEACAGFCSQEAVPWLPVSPGFVSTNVEMQENQPGSLLQLYQDVLALRRANQALRVGDLRLLDGPECPDDVLAYARQAQDQRALVLLNFGKERRLFHNTTGCRHVLLAIDNEAAVASETVSLPPLSGMILGDRGSAA
ncbi:MAG: alpha-glucosidase [Caldilineaceae bacterium]